jgi:cytolysin (calcineurin-like family phosphatase)
MMEQQILTKLTDTMDDIKERVIRIEEGLKDVHALKTDVNDLKVSVAKVGESDKSSHKRIDALEKQQEDKEKEMKDLKKLVYGGLISLCVLVIGAVIVASLGINK